MFRDPHRVAGAAIMFDTILESLLPVVATLALGFWARSGATFVGRMPPF